MIPPGLEPHPLQLEYREWERCGHYARLERHVGVEFSTVLRDWLSDNSLAVPP